MSLSPDQAVEQALRELGVVFARHDHPPVYTVAQARRLEIGRSETRVKCLFLRNRKGSRYYLLLARDETAVDLKALAHRLGETGLGLASPERLKARLGVEPGAVGPFGLLNDAGRAVTVVLEAGLEEAEALGFHPNINTATLVLAGAGVMKFFSSRGQIPIILR